MHPSLGRAREAVQTATELTDDATVHEQLNSIDVALAELSDDEVVAEDVEGDRLEEIERQLVTLGNDADGLAGQHIGVARDQIDAFRRAYAQDWE